MLSAETPARVATAVMVVVRNPSRSNSSRAASTTARRRRRACSRRPDASYVLLTSTITRFQTFSYSLTVTDWGVMLDNDLVPVSIDLVAVAVRSIHAMVDGERDEFDVL